MARSTDPKAYDTVWLTLMEQMRQCQPQLRIKSPTKKAQSLVMEFHCYRSAWLKESQRQRQLKNFPAAEAALDNYNAMIVYQARANKLENHVTLTFAPRDIQIEVIENDSATPVLENFPNLADGLASRKPFVYFSLTDYLPDPGEIAGWKQTRLSNDQIRFDPL